MRNSARCCTSSPWAPFAQTPPKVKTLLRIYLPASSGAARARATLWSPRIPSRTPSFVCATVTEDMSSA
eukprot:5778005-Pyramimonas_sp.AAC.1